MPHPKGGYRLQDGTRVPGVTTIIGRFKESGGLIHWGWNLGMQGKDYREVRDEAAGIGTIAHEMVDCDWHNRPFDASQYPADQVDKAETAFLGYLAWKQQSRLEMVCTETSFVSETLRVGGTLDAMLVQGQLSLGDVKTGSAIYQDVLIQLGAYALLWEEAHPDQPITGGYHILHFSKDTGDFTHKYLVELQDAKRAFTLMRELYDIDAKLKKRVK